MSISFAAVAVAVLLQVADTPDDVCYDRAVIGHIRHRENFAALDSLIQVQPGYMAVGARWDVEIAVDKVLLGSHTPVAMKARVVLTSLFTPKAEFLMLLRRGPVESGKDDAVREWNGRFIPHASAEHPWRIVFIEAGRHHRFNPDDPGFPRRCSAS